MPDSPEYTPEIDAELRKQLRPDMRAFRNQFTQSLLVTMSTAAQQGKEDVIAEILRQADVPVEEPERPEFPPPEEMAESPDAPGVARELDVLVDKAFVSDVLQSRHQTRALTWTSVKSEELLNEITNTVREAMDRGGAGVEDSLKSVFRGWVSDGTVDPATGQKLLNPHKLEAIHRTEAMKAYNEGRNEIMFDEDVEIVEAVQYSAILDSRTSKYCRNNNGIIVENTPEKQEFIQEWGPPAHTNCRSLLVPITKFEDFTESDSVPDVQKQSGFGVVPLDDVKTHVPRVAAIKPLPSPRPKKAKRRGVAKRAADELKVSRTETGKKTTRRKRFDVPPIDEGISGGVRPKRFTSEQIKQQKSAPGKYVNPSTVRGQDAKTSRALHSWVNGSGRKTSVEMKLAALEEFGGQGKVYSFRRYNIPKAAVRDTRKTLRKLYEETQADLKRKGIKKVRLYRGVKSEIRTPGSIESWTTDPELARKFDGHEVLWEDVPADEILTYHSGPSWNNGAFGEQHEYIRIRK
jgi:SPP1 gp7 family putative phage head morphogenesis protein